MQQVDWKAAESPTGQLVHNTDITQSMQFYLELRQANILFHYEVKIPNWYIGNLDDRTGFIFRLRLTLTF